VLRFVVTTAGTWGALALINITSSSLASITVAIEPSIFGFSLGSLSIGDFFEPLDEAVDYLYGNWVKALTWGILATFGAAISGYLIEYAIDLNLSLTTTGNSLISTGYGTILGLVNLGFVLAIIVMAFATMFRQSGWNAQSALAKLIIAALLVNFSLFFGGLIMDFGTSMTRAMIGSACPGQEFFNKFNIVTLQQDINTALSSVSSTGSDPGNAPDIGARTVIDSSLWTNIGNWIKDKITFWAREFFVAILSIFFAALLTIIGTLSMFAIFLFLIVRYVAVTILLIFAPIAWLGFIFPTIPGIGNLWKLWWSTFLKWVFLAPLLAFFLWLTVQFINVIGSFTSPSLIAGIAQMLTVIVFSLSTLWIANKFSVAGAQMVYGVVDKAIKSGQANFIATTKGIATAPLRTETGQKLLGGAARGKMKLFGVNIPTGTKQVGRQGLAASLATQGAGKEAMKDFKGLSPDRLNDVVAGYHPKSQEFAAGMEQLMKDKSLKDPDQFVTDRVQRGLKSSLNEKVYKDLEKFAVSTQKSIEELVKDNIDGAAQEFKGLFEKAKLEDLKKSFGIAAAFKQIDMEKFKNADNSYDTDAYNKAVDKAKKKQEAIVQGLLMASPEATMAAYTSLAQGQERNSFKEMTSGIIQNRDKFVHISSMTPERSGRWIKHEDGKPSVMEGFMERNVSKGVPAMQTDEAIEEARAAGKAEAEENKES